MPTGMLSQLVPGETISQRVARRHRAERGEKKKRPEEHGQEELEDTARLKDRNSRRPHSDSEDALTPHESFATTEVYANSPVQAPSTSQAKKHKKPSGLTKKQRRKAEKDRRKSEAKKVMLGERKVRELEKRKERELEKLERVRKEEAASLAQDSMLGFKCTVLSYGSKYGSLGPVPSLSFDVSDVELPDTTSQHVTEFGGAGLRDALLNFIVSYKENRSVFREMYKAAAARIQSAALAAETAKTSFSIAIQDTIGRRSSVAFAQKLGERLEVEDGCVVTIVHRDLMILGGRKRVPCVYFMTAKGCYRGDCCPFSHDAQYIEAAKDMLCKNSLVTGGCKYGNSCVFSHDLNHVAQEHQARQPSWRQADEQIPTGIPNTLAYSATQAPWSRERKPKEEEGKGNEAELLNAKSPASWSMDGIFCAITSYGSHFGPLANSPSLGFPVDDILVFPTALAKGLKTGMSGLVQTAVWGREYNVRRFEGIYQKVKAVVEKEGLKMVSGTISIALRGQVGRQTSVVFAEKLGERLREDGCIVKIMHRDIETSSSLYRKGTLTTNFYKKLRLLDNRDHQMVLKVSSDNRKACDTSDESDTRSSSSDGSEDKRSDDDGHGRSKYPMDMDLVSDFGTGDGGWDQDAWSQYRRIVR
ncbi:hypothetical protein BU16DRAFT_536198 [Lophium mytilinum]|uniref:C3H1-type domain-containing protein n=1 Tax=Lophium mytilinum TaxID=390894 RepID=A0A6A6R180_9PEZI|nr:hypothetical protein BU16DRAFT_536198 [Lophium mytilinum]